MSALAIGFVPRSRLLFAYESLLTEDVSSIAQRFIQQAEWARRPEEVDLLEVSQFVYFIGSVRSFVKIGYSTFVPARLDVLQKANPESLTILGVMLGPVLLERALQQRFSQLWVHGEWFRREGALAELLEKAPQ